MAQKKHNKTQDKSKNKTNQQYQVISPYINFHDPSLQIQQEIPNTHETQSTLNRLGVSNRNPLNVINQCLFVSQNRFVTSCCISNAIHLWDVEEGAITQVLSSKYDSSWIQHMEYIKNLKILVSYTVDNYMVLYKYCPSHNNKFKQIRRMSIGELIQPRFKYNDKTYSLYISSRSCKIYQINLKTFKICQFIQECYYGFMSFEFVYLDSLNYIFTGDVDGWLSLWSLPQLKMKAKFYRNEEKTIYFHKKVVHEIRVVYIGKQVLIITAGYDKVCNIFSLEKTIDQQNKNDNFKLNLIQRLECSVDHIEHIQNTNSFLMIPFPLKTIKGNSQVKLLSYDKQSNHFVIKQTNIMETNEFVNCIKYFQGKLVLGYKNNLVQVWNLELNQILDEQQMDTDQTDMQGKENKRISKKRKRQNNGCQKDGVIQQVQKILKRQ